MATKNPRLNITFEPEAIQILVQLSKSTHQSLSSLVRELTLDALERREDMALSKIAEELDKNQNSYVSHDQAWM